MLPEYTYTTAEGSCVKPSDVSNNLQSTWAVKRVAVSLCMVHSTEGSWPSTGSQLMHALA